MVKAMGENLITKWNANKEGGSCWRDTVCVQLPAHVSPQSQVPGRAMQVLSAEEVGVLIKGARPAVPVSGGAGGAGCLWTAGQAASRAQCSVDSSPPLLCRPF